MFNFRLFLLVFAMLLAVPVLAWQEADSLPKQGIASIGEQQIAFYSGLKLHWEGSSDSCEVVDLPLSPGQVHHTLLRELYPQIDLVVTADREQNITYEFVVHPGGDPRDIALRIEGARWVPWSRTWQTEDGQRQYRWEGLKLTSNKGDGCRQQPLLFTEQDGQVSFCLQAPQPGQMTQLRWEQRQE